MKPLVSIIIPTYNRPRLLAECLQAIALDPYRYKQVIIVNDGGTDPSTTIAPFAARLPIELLDLSNNHGHVYARNRGIQRAEGDLIMLCDDDDLIVPGHLTRMVQSYRPEADCLLYSDVEIVTYTHANGRRQPMQRTSFAFDFDRDLLRRWNIIISSGILYPRQLHEAIGFFDEDMRDYWDWDFFLRISELEPIRRVPYADVLYMVSALGENLSANRQTMSKSLERLKQKHDLDDLPVSSFSLMTQEPALKPFRRPSCLMWNGTLDFTNW